MSLMREKYKKKFGTTDKQIDNMLDMIGYVESKNKNIAQDSGVGKIGPGRGFFQFEATAKDKEGKFAQGSAVTALKRVRNAYMESKVDIPDWAKRDMEKDFENPSIGFNAMLLNREQQEEMILADLYIKSGGSFANIEKDKKSKQPLLKKALQGDVKELWLKEHWAGAENLLKSKNPEEQILGAKLYKEKGDQWDRDIQIFKKTNTVDNIAFNAMNNITKTKPIISGRDIA